MVNVSSKDALRSPTSNVAAIGEIRGELKYKYVFERKKVKRYEMILN